MAGFNCWAFFKVYWRTFVVFLIPLAFSPVIICNDNGKAFRVMWLLMTMAVFWITEALPLVITSSLPIIILPLMNIMDTNAVTMQYWKETTVMLLGSLAIATAIESSMLHKRIAMLTMKAVGCSQRKISFSLMCVTTFMSMWISNTAACAMMLPIGLAVLQEVENKKLCKVWYDVDPENPDAVPEPTNIANALFLGIMYASTIGGCCTLIGTGTNLVLSGQIVSSFHSAPEIKFVNFMLYATPIMWLFMGFTWFWLQVLWLGMFRPKSAAYKEGNLGPEGNAVMREAVREKYAELGPISSYEAWVLALFVLAILLWFFRAPGFMPGWEKLFVNAPKPYVKDATATFFVVLIMFIIPKKWSWLEWCKTRVEDKPKKAQPGLLTWKLLNEKLPWNLMFLLGAGFAMAEAGKISGMNALIAEKLSKLKSLPKEVILMIIVLVCQLMTEFASNVAVSNIVLPILATMCVSIRINPVYLMLPATLACSMALNTVMGTPPNGVAVQMVYLRPKAMFKSGCVLSLFSWILICVTFPTYGSLLFDDLTKFPKWAEKD